MGKLLSLTFVLIGFVSQSSQAWETLVSCDGGKFLIEKDCLKPPSQYGGEGCYVTPIQMVIRNPEVQNLFSANRAFGSVDQRGISYGYYPQTPEMVIKIDSSFDWGFSGSYDYSVNIPYYDITSTPISYYINIDKQNSNSVQVKAHSKYGFKDNIVRKGDLATYTYRDCYIK